ncbi:16S rRNA (guanine(527)-N(7))-methyltransferase RsmG [bacterium]|nr:16S rRNA (guanine(527)-N(7))-methyltransferase RsmG [bacterium]
MYEELKKLEIDTTDEEKEKLSSFSALFLDYNTKVNLISKNDAALLFEKHIYDSLAYNLFLKKYNIIPQNMLDIGTGGGFPSIPISIFYKNTNIYAIDSINKKINFIEYIKQRLILNNLFPICTRAENLPDNNKGYYDIVVSRAMAELRIILEYSIPFLKKDGYFIAYKSIKADKEIINAQNALKTLNAQIIDKIEYSLPLKDGNKRVLVIVKKLKETENRFPRRNGQIKNNPL